MIRHLFGVGEDEVMEWTADRWERHKAWADHWMKQNGWEVRGG